MAKMKILRIKDEDKDCKLRGLKMTVSKLLLPVLFLSFTSCQLKPVSETSAPLEPIPEIVESHEVKEPSPLNKSQPPSQPLPKDLPQSSAPKKSKISYKIKKLPLDGIWLENKYFKTLYSKNNNIAYFSTYVRTSDELCLKIGKRKNSFKGDVRLKTHGLPMPVKTWYFQPYDKGHLAPSADFLDSQTGADETFKMSNMTPQINSFNRHAWASLEKETRGWGIFEGKISVITGPILEPGLSNMEPYPVPIPRKHFKAILDMTEPRKMIGFIMPQTDSKASDFKQRVVSVSEIEKIVGFSLFDEDQNLKSKADLSQWKTKKCL